MADVKTKLLNAFEALKKEGKKISPFAVETGAGCNSSHGATMRVRSGTRICSAARGRFDAWSRPR